MYLLTLYSSQKALVHNFQFFKQEKRKQHLLSGVASPTRVRNVGGLILLLSFILYILYKL